MNRKTVKIDKQTLQDLVLMLVEYRNSLNCYTGGINMAITGLTQVANFHQDFVARVSVPSLSPWEQCEKCGGEMDPRGPDASVGLADCNTWRCHNCGHTIPEMGSFKLGE
jgi:hypothetical protein